MVVVKVHNSILTICYLFVAYSQLLISKLWWLWLSINDILLDNYFQKKVHVEKK